MHGMRGRLYHEARDGFIREQTAKARTAAKAEVFSKLFEDDFNFKCVLCGSPMKAKRNTKLTCSDRCRTRLSRLQRATKNAQRRAQEERDDDQRLNRLPRAECKEGDRRFVMVK
jgi:hypothetical protein